MRCFIDTRGGGAVKTAAFIVVNTAAGAELICTNGFKAFRATTVSGKHVFTVPETGTWAIEASLNGESRSGSVAVTEYGQSLGLTLLFDTIIFNPSAGVDLAGAWLNSTFLTMRLPEVTVTDRLNISYGGVPFSYPYGTLVYAENQIDITQLQNIEFEIAGVSQNNNDNPVPWTVGLITYIPSGIDLVNFSNPPDFARSFNPTTGGKYSLDVSALSGLYYIGYYTLFNGAGNEYWTKGSTISTTKILGN